MQDPFMHRRALGLLLACALALGGGTLPGCGPTSSSSDDDEGGRSGRSSGDEEEGSGGSGGRSGLESPPGSRDPGDDSIAEGDLEDDDDGATGASGGSTSGGTAATGGSTASSPGTGGSDTAAESPWGSADTESGEALPTRRPMTGSAGDSFRRGLSLASSGDDAGARSAFEAALSADSGAFRAEYNLGVLADRGGNEEEALRHYRNAIRIQPDYEAALEGICTIHIRNGRAGEAVTFMRPIAERWVRNLAVQAVYGRALVAAGRESDAIAAMRPALRRDERFVPVLRVIIAANLSLGRRELAESVLSQALAIDDNDAELHFFRARLHEDDDHLREAMDEYRRAIALRGDYADARTALGLLLLAGANYDDALAQFEVVARLQSRVAAAHLHLGEAYRSTKNWEKARDAFNRVLELDANNAEVHFDLGLFFMARAAEAEAAENRSQQLDFLQQAQAEFVNYRNLMGSRLARDDPSTAYGEEIQRGIDRTKRAIDRDAARAARDAERAAREAEEAAAGGGEAPAGGDGG